MKTVFKGDVVRLKRGKETAVVLADALTFWSRTIEGCLFLDRPLSGFRYWNADDVRVVTPAARSSQS